MASWAPDPALLQQSLEVLRASQSPNTDVQRNVQQVTPARGVLRVLRVVTDADRRCWVIKQRLPVPWVGWAVSAAARHALWVPLLSYAPAASLRALRSHRTTRQCLLQLQRLRTNLLAFLKGTGEGSNCGGRGAVGAHCTRRCHRAVLSWSRPVLHRHWRATRPIQISIATCCSL